MCFKASHAAFSVQVCCKPTCVTGIVLCCFVSHQSWLSFSTKPKSWGQLCHMISVQNSIVLLQNSINQLLQQYVSHLIRTEQHALVPVYACHMRQDVRHATYASYFHGLTQRDMADCHQAYASAQQTFSQFPRGDIDGNTELDSIVAQVSCACGPIFDAQR